MARKSKTKGAGFERLIAKKFSKALGVELYRTPLSGGWGKMQTKGDLVGDGFGYFVECKKSENWNLFQVFAGIGPVDPWWEKCKEQATEEGKEPLLVFSRNRVGEFVRLHQDLETIDAVPVLLLCDGSAVIRLGDFFEICKGGQICTPSE